MRFAPPPAENVLPASGVKMTIAGIGAAVALMGVSAQVEIPFYPVPVSGQSLAVLFAAGALGMRNGTLAILIYIIAGLMGLPVFAGGSAGWTALSGASGGYLAGFVPAAMLVGYLCQTGWQKSFIRLTAAMTIGTLVILFAGVLWLAQFVGWERVLEYGVIPFIPGAVIKILLSAAAVKAVQHFSFLQTK